MLSTLSVLGKKASNNALRVARRAMHLLPTTKEQADALTVSVRGKLVNVPIAMDNAISSFTAGEAEARQGKNMAQVTGNSLAHTIFCTRIAMNQHPKHPEIFLTGHPTPTSNNSNNVMATLVSRFGMSPHEACEALALTQKFIGQIRNPENEAGNSCPGAAC
jgi:hypothetical protein